jgi:hypothetical protein
VGRWGGGAILARDMKLRGRPWAAVGLPWAAVGLLLLNLAVAVPVGLYQTFLRLRAAAATARLGTQEMRSLVFGRRYNAAIVAMRRAIPVDEPYLLDSTAEPGAILWVRFDLLPRRAVVLRPELAAALASDCLLRQVRWKVVGIGVGRPPLLLGRPVSVPAGCPRAPWLAADAPVPQAAAGPPR